jgi:fido (protein-threonine AMPylation protein)
MIPSESPEYIDAKMHDLGEWVQTITKDGDYSQQNPLVLAAAAHAWLAQIHPFVDGNGRTARILMNLILMRRGYPICIILRDDRLRYYDALERSQISDLTPLIELMYENTEESLEEWEKAAEEQRREQEWLADITARFAKPALAKAQNEYAVWSKAMDLLQSYFKQTITDWNERVQGGAHVFFRDFGMLNFEKYVAIRDGETAKRTWFFRIDFMSGNRTARYLFFFGYGHINIRSRAPVVLIVAKEIEPYSFERLENISQSNIPDIHQIGYDMKSESFIALTPTGLIDGKIESLGKQFLEQVVRRDFGE